MKDNTRKRSLKVQRAVAILIMVTVVVLTTVLFLTLQGGKICCWQCALSHLPLCDAAQRTTF